MAPPERGDLIWLFLPDQEGHEQGGRRPFLVLSPRIYNEASSVAIGCPVTTNVKPYAFKVILPEGGQVTGAVLADQVRAVDLTARKMKPAGRAPDDVVQTVTARLGSLLGILP